MAITWGNTSNYFRLGIEVTGSGSSRTVKVLGQSVGYGHDWSATLVRSGSWSGSKAISFYSGWNATVTKTLYNTTVTKNGTYTASMSYWGGSSSVSVSISNIGGGGGSGSGTPAPKAPSTPSGVSLSRTSGDNVKISWNKMARATSYALQQQVDSTSASWTDLASGITGTSSTRNITIGDIRRRYRVKAVGDGGSSKYSSATPWFYTTPARPTNLTVSGTELSDMTLAYTGSKYNYGVQIALNSASSGSIIRTVGSGLQAVGTTAIIVPTDSYSASDKFYIRTFAGPDNEPRGRAYSSWSAASNTVVDGIYSPPVIVKPRVQRETSGQKDPLGTGLRAIMGGRIFSEFAGNTWTARCRRREIGGSWKSWVSVSPKSPETSSTNPFSGADVLITGSSAPIDTAYEIEFELTDNWGTSTAIAYVSTGEVALSLGKTGAAVGKVRDTDSVATFEVGGHISVEDPSVVVINNTAYSACGRITISSGIPINTSTGSIYRSDTIAVPIGVTPPSGWSWMLTVMYSQAGGWGSYVSGSTSATPNIRLFSSVSTTSLTAYVAYQLVKHGS